jgi:hypothetical protein
LVICLQSMTDTVVRCTYGLPKLTCTSVAVERHATRAL